MFSGVNSTAWSMALFFPDFYTNEQPPRAARGQRGEELGPQPDPRRRFRLGSGGVVGQGLNVVCDA